MSAKMASLMVARPFLPSSKYFEMFKEVFISGDIRNRINNNGSLVLGSDEPTTKQDCYYNKTGKALNALGEPWAFLFRSNSKSP